MKKLKAFTFGELLVVLIIIGILVLISLPNLMPLVNRARSVEAQQGLKTIYALQKTHYMQHLNYATELEDIGFEMEQSGDGNNIYSFSVSKASETGFIAIATATKDFDKDGVFNQWQIDENKNLKETVKD